MPARNPLLACPVYFADMYEACAMQLVTVCLIRDIVQVDLQMLCKLGWSSCKATGSGPRSDALTASCRSASILRMCILAWLLHILPDWSEP